jgi:AcrR family transcriptional regulator
MSRLDYINRRAAAKRAAVLKAARVRFAEDGLEGANVERIAQEAGVSTATLYRQFPSKLALFSESLSDGLADFEKRLTELSALPAEDRLDQLACAYAELLDDRLVAGMLRAVLSAAPASPEVTRIFFERVKGTTAAAFHAAVEAAAAAGRIARPQQAVQPGSHLMGMIEHGTIWRRMLTGEDGETPPRRIAEDALKTFWAAYGVAKPKGKAK